MTVIQPSPKQLTKTSSVHGTTITSLLQDESGLINKNLLEDNFVLSDLFKDFTCDTVNNYVFDGVSLQLSAADKNTLTFTGHLKMDGALSIFKNFLDSDASLLITAELVSNNINSADKIVPQKATFKCVVPFHKILFNGVTLTEVSFELEINQSNNKWIITPKLIGTLDILNVTDQSSSTLSFEITENHSTLILKANANHYHGAFGINELNLESLAITGNVGKTDSLDVTAQLVAGTTTFDFAGEINAKASALIAKANNFTLTNLETIFEEITGTGLELPNFDVDFKNTSIALATADCTLGSNQLTQGFTLISNITAHTHEITTTAHISTKSVTFDGTLNEFTLGPIDVKKTTLDFAIYSKSQKKPAQFEIKGESVIEGITVDSNINFEKNNTILSAQLSADSFGLGNIFSAAKNTFVGDLTFSKVCFIYTTQACTTSVAGQSYTVQSGLQLMGVVEEIPGLSELTGSKHIGLVLSGHLGSTTNISIAIPETRLNLGHSVECDPLKIKIDITPEPTLSLIFGMNITIPNQTNPLHFDMMLALDALGAKGSVTMKNYWKNPFGIHGVKIGPALALQIGIIYEQFISTGTPSEFGIIGGLEIGDTIIDMAVNISENPSEEILVGKLEKLAPSQLINFASNLIDLNIPHIPNFFEFNDLEIYCAPTGGSIGTVTYEPGFSFSANLTIANKDIALYTRVSDSAIEGAGSIEKMSFGPLTISGEQGKNARVNLQLSDTTQSLLIDGAISFLGFEESIYVDISNNGIAFKFEQDFFDELTFEINGQSSGSLSSPENLNFMLSGEMNNNITSYLKTQVTTKIHTALNATESKIDEAQEKVNSAQKAYEALYKPAQQELNQAQIKADALLKQLTDKVSDLKSAYAQNLTNAENAVNKAKGDYNTALNNAQSAVNSAQQKYNSALTSAQNSLNSAQRTYNSGITTAQNAINSAEKTYNNSMRSAQSAVSSASQKVDSLLKKADSLKRQISKLPWYEKPYAAVLGSELAGVYTAYGVAKAALATAQEALKVVQYGADYTALEAAKTALQVAKTGANYAAFKLAKTTLQAVKTGGDYTTFESAKETLEAVKQGGDYIVWQTAEKTLNTVKTTGEAAIAEASNTLEQIGKTTTYIALQTAKEALKTIEKGSEAIAFDTAKAALAAAKVGSSAMLKLAAYIAEHTGDIIDIKSFSFSADLKDIQKGDLFKAQLNLNLLTHNYNWTLDLDVKDIPQFIDNLFNKALNEIKTLLP